MNFFKIGFIWFSLISWVYEFLKYKQKNDIKDNLGTILGDKLSLNFKVDKKIIGGLIVKVGSKMIDTSIANKINKLKIAMKGA